jgi:hypothetical protein
MASGISPVEAMRYQEPTGKQKRKKSYKTLSVSKLSWATIQRNKRRTVVTILALGCSGILFLAVANIANNITAENYARMLMPKGDFEISLNYAEGVKPAELLDEVRKHGKQQYNSASKPLERWSENANHVFRWC